MYRAYGTLHCVGQLHRGLKSLPDDIQVGLQNVSSLRLFRRHSDVASDTFCNNYNIVKANSGELHMETKESEDSEFVFGSHYPKEVKKC